MRRDSFAQQRRLLLCCRVDMFGETECEAIAGDGLPVRVEKYLGDLSLRTDDKPCAECGLGLFP